MTCADCHFISQIRRAGYSCPAGKRQARMPVLRLKIGQAILMRRQGIMGDFWGDCQPAQHVIVIDGMYLIRFGPPVGGIFSQF